MAFPSLDMRLYAISSVTARTHLDLFVSNGV
jgi:hypothetical protein